MAAALPKDLRRLPAVQHRANQVLSTQRRQSGILMDVDPVPSR
jgi:hypothetical protein